MAQLIVNVPGTAEGELIEVPPFGLVANGSTVDIDEEMEVAYDTYMKYLSHDSNWEWDGEDVIIPTPTPEQDTPVEEVEPPVPTQLPAPEPEDGE